MNNTPVVMSGFEAMAPASPEHVLQRRKAMTEIVKKALEENKHYGIIPGTEKPTLLKPGAEILANMFALRSEFKVQRDDLPGGHREYHITCTLTHGSEVVSEGLGSCSTMEKKYRWRYGDPEPTDLPIPPKYWDVWKADKSRAQGMLPNGHRVTKIDGVWRVAKNGEQVENPNIADCYNTCLKIAKKRAYIDGIITATAGSEYFTQDLDDFGPEDLPSSSSSSSSSSEAKKQEPARTDNVGSHALAPEGQLGYQLPFKHDTVNIKAARDALVKAGFKPDKSSTPWTWWGDTHMPEYDEFRVVRDEGPSFEEDSLPDDWGNKESDDSEGGEFADQHAESMGSLL